MGKIKTFSNLNFIFGWLLGFSDVSLFHQIVCYRQTTLNLVSRFFILLLSLKSCISIFSLFSTKSVWSVCYPQAWPYFLHYAWIHAEHFLFSFFKVAICVVSSLNLRLLLRFCLPILMPVLSARLVSWTGSGISHTLVLHPPTGNHSGSPKFVLTEDSESLWFWR